MIKLESKIKKLERAIVDLKKIGIDEEIIQPLKNTLEGYKMDLLTIGKKTNTRYLIVHIYNRKTLYFHSDFEIEFGPKSKQSRLAKWRGRYSHKETMERNLKKLDFSGLKERDCFNTIEECQKLIDKWSKEEYEDFEDEIKELKYSFEYRIIPVEIEIEG